MSDIFSPNNMDSLSTNTYMHYADNEYYWRTMELAYKGGREYVVKNLEKHVREEKVLFEARLKRAYYMNYCKSFINTIVSYIFARPEQIDIQLPDRMRYLDTNCDNMGTPLINWMKMAMIDTLKYGQLGVLVDSPRVNREILTKEDQIIENLEYYLCSIKPYEVRNYNLDIRGVVQWVVIHQRIYDQESPFIPVNTIDLYSVWYPDHVDIYQTSTLDSILKPVLSVKHTFGRVPFWWLIIHDSDQDQMGESFIQDLHPINKNIMNLWSLIDEQAYATQFPIWLIPSDSISTVAKDEKGDKVERKITYGTQIPFLYDPTTEGNKGPELLTPSSDPINVLMAMIATLKDEMIRLCGLSSPGQASAMNTSGLAKSIDFMDINNTLSLIGQTFGNKLVPILKSMAETLGLPESEVEAINITFPTDYNIYQLKQIIDDFTAVGMLVDNPMFKNAMDKILVRKTLDNYLSLKDQEEILDSLEIPNETEVEEAPEEPIIMEGQQNEE